MSSEAPRPKCRASCAAQANIFVAAQRGDVRGVAPVNTAEQDAAEVVEPYDRSVSPPLIDIRKLHHEEREIDILTTVEDLRQLVCLV